MHSPTLKIQGARFIVTVDPERRIIQDGALLVEGQRITRIGKTAELRDVAADQVMPVTWW
jgi:cytosine/adenosine deaminase-related metal-dependent hydrolase